MSLNNSNKNLLNSLESSSSPFESYSTSSNSTTSTSTNSIWDSIKNMSWLTWILILFVLAILGFNIFTYLAVGTEFIAEWSQKIINLFKQVTGGITGTVGHALSDTAKQIVSVSATGATTGIDVVADTTIGAINALDNIGSNQNANANAKQSHSTNPGSSINNTNSNPIPVHNDNNLNKALNESIEHRDIEADDSYSSIQSSKPAGKAGWCFIGEDRGIRSCMKVGLNDTCMSGDIFPTNQVCINPNLRA